MAKFFGTNGIRGVFSEDLTLEFVHDMTLAIGTYFEKGTVLIGFDGRESSPVISKVVSSALNSIGIDCNVVGIVPTPCLQFAVKTLGYSGGIMITASHNPPQYNGIKPTAKDGVEISRGDELVVEDIYLQKSWIKNTENWGTTGKEERAIETYLKGIVSQIDSKLIESKNFKVVLDLGNGVQAVSAPDFCKMMQCETLLVNQNIDGKFPGRGSEPTPQNLSELSQTVTENNADFGIAFDGDGDRSIFCDNKGNILTGDKSALALTQHILKKNSNSVIVTCLNSGSNIEVLADKFNSKVIRTKIGSVEVSRKMIHTNALIGFEENGGYMYGKHNQVRDGCMTLALMLDLLATGKSLSDEIANLPPSFTTKDKVSCSPENASKLISLLKEEFPGSDTTDGIKITTDPKNWVMIRPSGTEPIVRVYAEAESQEKLDILMSEYLNKVKSIISR
ncbi:phosphoglucosamine mutase [Marine Group I thaumarchaeote]|uniref:Phosphoglucosamine mutase n=1 Tax=Marine Group I thaumarchaeote TaxID=2511932 RepID=A0A7K4NHA9_9ARCH|nr:MAG: phosphoglucosamine mutase [Nitrosopumilus sp. YT1]NMI81886.1 phosphoglucosamine mutase [Candidatus Nitrosopumilus sp. MTA1]NWJ19827.1 phosphoglucosamine mutase [Marine Group I thaumarchaeote]NWJ29153.1 phosphoglucosamine mutase [Marine Group I thaumarchaeote]NWJ57574.1 phosphoglucosamine mutase [Marine Group I thaumarchaeote]